VEGVSWVEFDVTLSADGVPVVFHDDTLDRTTDGSGLVKDAPSHLLRTLDAGGWFSSRFTGETVPTLIETLSVLRDLRMGFNVEFKQDEERDAETVGDSIALMRGLWRDDLPLPLISSFSSGAVATARELQPRWPRSLLFEDLPSDWRQRCRGLALSYVGLDDRHVTEDTVRAVKRQGYGVMVYTVNEVSRAAALRGWGVDSIFTDLPRVMLAVT